MEEKDQWNDLETDHDIYGDLESSIFTSSRQPQKSPADAARIESLLKDNSELKRQLQKLKRENNTLLKNISSLHLTAKNEIDKKNFLINGLQKKLTDLLESKCHANTITKKEADEILKQCQEAYSESRSKITVNEIKQEISEILQTKSIEDSKTKSFKFGNMSWYFFNHQFPCHRNEPIEFPTCQRSQSDKSSLLADNKNLPVQLIDNSKNSKGRTSQDGKIKVCPNNISTKKSASLKAIREEKTDDVTPVKSDDDDHRTSKRQQSRHTSSSNNPDSVTDANKNRVSKERTPKSGDKKANGVRQDSSQSIRKSPRHLNNNKKSTRRSREEELFGPSRHSRNHSSERKSENIYKKHYERKRSLEASPRVESRSSESSKPYSERGSRTSSAHSSKRHRRDIS